MTPVLRLTKPRKVSGTSVTSVSPSSVQASCDSSPLPESESSPVCSIFAERCVVGGFASAALAVPLASPGSVACAMQSASRATEVGMLFSPDCR